MSPKDDREYLESLRNNLEDMARYVAIAQRDGLEDIIRRAILHCYTEIAEAVNHLPEAWRAEHRNIPWSQLIGMRNKIVHGYRSMRTEIVWATVSGEDFVELRKAIAALCTKYL